MIFGSVCSGIEAASVAWKPLGWHAAFLSEIEAFPRAVLAHHYPGTPLHGDFTTIQAGRYEPIDLLVGGTPCQSFSVAGLRGGLADERGNLALEFLRLAERLRPRWLVWENVPGVLSSGDGRDFGSFLGGLVQLGYGFAYRVLDAQFFGLAQRRKRVFVVGHLGDWRRAAAVLFEPASLRWNPPPRREERQGTTGTLSARASAGGGLGTDFECDGGVIASLDFKNQESGGNRTWAGPDEPTVTLNTGANIGVAHALRADGFDASEDGTRRGTPLMPVAFGWQNSSHQGDSVSEHTSPTLDKSKTAAVLAFDPTQISSPTNRSNPQPNGPCHTLAKGQHAPAVALDLRNALRDPEKQDALNRQGCGIGDDLAHTLSAGVEHGVATGAAVRRLTPEECEALQGFPRGYTDVPHRGKQAADGPRYRALGNSMAVPCMAWIGRRIAAQEAEIRASQQAAA